MNSSFKPRTLFLRTLGVLIVLIVIVGIWYSLKEKPSAPNLSFTTIQGETLTLSQLRGKAVLINFWATSCPGCVKEMPEIEQTYKQWHKKGFVVLAIAMSYDSLNYIRPFQKKEGLTFPIVYDKEGKLAHAFKNVELTPTDFYIDPRGHIIQETVGATNFKKLNAWLSQTLVQG
ncbi:MAG: TlpA family protein disulfide reductase [Proteobacteria bacterium]|nr:TlpA family protein disulfide reductase [Pseudomonadota bacterium]MDE3209002.1 TlpA family protein disulfide reductase [Pseudomonadota bacterium]